ncbi:MAG: ABC transporter ATP-binding protein [Pseudomonadota bacterium]
MYALFERLLSAFPRSRASSPPDGLLAFGLYYLRDAWPLLVAVSAIAALVAVLEVLLVGFLGDLVDLLAASDPATFFEDHARTLSWMALVVLVVLPATVLLWSLVLFQALSGNLPMSARWRMHRHLLNQSLDFFADEFAGRVATKVMQTALALREAASKLLDVLVYVGVYFVATVALVAGSDWRLMLPFLGWLAVYVALIVVFVPRLAAISERQSDARSAMTGRIVDSYTNITTVKLFAHARREAGYARESMETFLGTVHPQMRLITTFYWSVYTANSLLVFLVAALAILLWRDAAVSIGAIAVAIALCLRLNGMATWIMWEVSALFEAIGTIYDGKSMLTRRVSVTDRSDAEALPAAQGHIVFDDVRFHYGKEGGVIEGLSLAIRPGERVGLVGRSGAGKTTLCNLLLRFFDVEGGTVLIDGHDVRAVTQDSLRAQVGVVTQDTALLHRSIRENIAYGAADASDDAIWRAARRANAEDFIADLEDHEGRRGLDAHVGERGVKLSGGQRQRVAIARMFLKDAPILVLDEATSALDSEVEAAIQEHLFELMQGKTVIAIAHRLSTIAAMDRLVVLDQGQIIEQGTHDELVAAGGLYAELWARQSGGFLVED